MRKAIFAFVLGVCTLVATLAGAEHARADKIKPARLVVDAETGKVLVADRANLPWYPASLTKLMTAYITFSEIAAGRLSLRDTITVSAQAASQPPTKFGLRTGQKVTVEQAFEAMLVTSANDAAYALAERIGGGSASDFVGRMNATAQSLGMVDTHFVNPNGLPDDAQITTARDIAVLAMAIVHNFPDRYSVFSMRQASIGKRSLPTVNSLLGSYPGADGMKTGFTCGSGYNIVGSAVHDGQRLIAVVLGAHDRGQRIIAVRGLLDSGFKGGGTVPNTISNIAMVPAGLANATPPTVLKGSECEASDQVDTADDEAAPVRLPGWGIIFGSYSSPDVARQAIGGAQAKLKAGALTGGRPAVVKRTFEGTTRYAALLVGLKADAAGDACRMMWHRAEYCLALNPTVLNDPHALWR
jgi:D-alanyl-D-alanine carboxypeptidase